MTQMLMTLTPQEYTSARRRMIQSQIKSRGIHDTRVLQAMEKVERHLFVCAEDQATSYADHPLPIGEGQTISQPYIVALMTELMALQGEEKVLEIGTGCGYQTAVLAECAQEVYSLEVVPTLSHRAKNTLDFLDYKNVHLECGDGRYGLPEAAPFDAIMVTCAPRELPQPLIGQLAMGGRLVVPVGEFRQTLKCIVKQKGGLIEEDILPVSFVPMVKK